MFVNEYISEEDKKKHNMSSTSRFYLVGTTNWTVDRERDMFLLRRSGGGRENDSGIAHWAFYWRGHLLDVTLQAIDLGVDPVSGRGWERRKLLAIDDIPPELNRRRDEIIRDLKEALVAHKGLGIYSRCTSYEVTLEV